MANYSPLAGVNTAAAAAGNVLLKQTLDAIIAQTNQNSAGLKTVNLDSGSQSSPSSPPAGDFTVQGQDGNFIVDVVFPQDATPLTQKIRQNIDPADTNPTGAQMYYQLRSSDDLAVSVNVATFDADTAAHKVINQPNATKYWQIRFSYDLSTWTEWEYFTSTAVCGPVPVWSGLVRNSSSVLVDSATTPSGTNPLTQHSTTTQIDIAATTWKDGDQTIVYNGGSVDPGTYGTWKVYAPDQFRKGGTVVFVATQNDSDITASLYNIFFGKITTSAGGGGTGSGGGGGTCCREGVTYRKHDGTDVDCSTLQLGDVLMGIDGGPEVIQKIDVIPGRPCFRLAFDLANGRLIAKSYIGDFTVYRIELDHTHTFLAGAGGLIDGACSEHTIQYARGGFTSVFDAVPTELYNLVNGAAGSHNQYKL